MNLNLLSKTFLKLSKVYAVHSIPGRLRVKIPGLEYAKGIVTNEEAQNLFQQYRLKGVDTLEVNFLTSNALITYNENVTSKEQILKFLNDLRVNAFELLKNQGKLNNESITKIFNALKEEGYVFEKI